jgi:hypothetical protein
VITTSIVLLAVALVGLLVLKHSVKHAPVGFEDDHGFHEGMAAQPVADVQGAQVSQNVRVTREGFRPKRRLSHVLRRSFGHGS